MITLSICIATFNRASYIAETLDSIVHRLTDDVELLIVDGASSDITESIVRSYVKRFPHIRYFREVTNSGVDQDYDKAVGYARGDYCWLMTDDDIVLPGTIDNLLARLVDRPDLVVLNAEVRDAQLRRQLQARMMPLEQGSRDLKDDMDTLMTVAGQALSFIGCVVIKRSIWMERERKRFYGSLFIHVGVIFQAPLSRVILLAAPAMVIRYGNAMWTARGFEIWMFKWPGLIWSFPGISDTSKSSVCAPKPWKKARSLIFQRANGSFSPVEYQRFVIPASSAQERFMPWLIVSLPATLINAFAGIYYYLFNRGASGGIYDIARSRCASSLTKYLAKRMDVPASNGL